MRSRMVSIAPSMEFVETLRAKITSPSADPYLQYLEDESLREEFSSPSKFTEAPAAADYSSIDGRVHPLRGVHPAALLLRDCPALTATCEWKYDRRRAECFFSATIDWCYKDA